MKKVLALTLAAMMALAACSQGSSTPAPSAPATENQPAAQAAEPASQAAEPAAQAEPEAPAAAAAEPAAAEEPVGAISALPPMTTDPITLRYAFWGQHEKGEPEVTVAQREAFMKKYPNINAEFVEIDQFQWGEALMNFAATGTLPDVFGVFSVTEAVMNEWVLPLDDLFDAEPDTNQLSPAFANAKIGGVRYHMPTVMFPHIMYINKTYFERYNVPLPSYDWTTEDFFKLAPELTHPEEFYFGTSNPIYEDLFPSWFNGGQGKWGYDGENYNFDQVWVDAMTLRYDWIEKDVIEWEGPEDKEKFLGDPEAWPPGWGRTAMHIEWPWSFAYWTDVVSVQSGCEFLFYPMPKGPTNDQLMIVDAAVISLNTKYPREAWELLKDTCWGIDANLVRQQSYRDTGVSVSRMPVNSSQVLWDDLMDHANDNLKETYKRIQACNFVPSNWTYSPAWGELEAWINEQDIYGRMERREISPADVAPEMHAKARELKDAWLANNPYN